MSGALALCWGMAAAVGSAGPAGPTGAVAADAEDAGMSAPISPVAPALVAGAVAETLFARAEQAFNAGRVDQALELYRQVPTASPLLGRALFGEGRCRVALGQAEPAVRLFQQVEDSPDTSAAGRLAAADAADMLGRIYLDQGRHDAARRAFHELARRSPERRDYAAVMVARSYRDDGAWYDAYAALKPVLQEGRSDDAYDLAIDLYWNLDAGTQRELSRLMRTHLARPNRELTDSRSQ